jgi:hypothetical protein
MHQPMRGADSPRPWLAIVLIEIWLAVLAWRDLTRRPRDQVRGDPKMWRTLIAIQPGNALLYWLLGRR